MEISSSMDYSQIAKNLTGLADAQQKAAKSIGDSLSAAENNFMKVASNKNSTEGEIMAAQQQYMKASRVFQAMAEVFKAADQLMRDVIRKLGLS